MLFLWSRESSVIPPSPRAGPWFAWFATAVLVWRCRRRIASAIFGDSSASRRKRAHLIVSKAHLHHNQHHRDQQHRHKNQRHRQQRHQQQQQQQQPQPQQQQQQQQQNPQQPSQSHQQQMQQQSPTQQMPAQQPKQTKKHHKKPRSKIGSTRTTIECAGDHSRVQRHIGRPFRPQKFQKHAENTLSRRQQQHQEMRHEMSVVKSRLKRLNAGDGPHMIKTTRKLARGTNYVRISQQVYYRMTRSGRVYGKYPTKSTTAAVK